jgi:hypothetical protein
MIDRDSTILNQIHRVLDPKIEDKVQKTIWIKICQCVESFFRHWIKSFFLLTTFSMYDINESRFVWNFSWYCLNYCAKIKYKLEAVRISFNHQRANIDTNQFSDKDDPL